MAFFTSDNSFLKTPQQSWSYQESNGEHRFETRAGDYYDSPLTPEADDDAALGKNRSEISSYRSMQIGREFTVEFDVLVEDGAANTADWMVLAQFRQTEDRDADGNPIDGIASPPLALMMRGDRMEIAGRYDTAPATLTTPDRIEIEDGTMYLDDDPIERDQWYNMRFEVVFDAVGGSGHLKVWRDDVLLVEYDGPLGYNDDVGPALQLGVYRAEAPETYAARFRNFEASGDGAPSAMHGTAGDDHIRANSLGFWEDETLIGGAGDDTLDGGYGDDTMRGGAGDDVYVVNSTYDVVDEREGGVDQGGIDVVRSYVDRVIGNDIENIVLWGEDDLAATGNAKSNEIGGNGGDNTLWGAGGDDTLLAHNGNDAIHGGTGMDSLFGGAGEDTLWGDSGDDRLFGEGGNDTLYGGAGDDILEGGAGDDWMAGGTGNDAYRINNADDVVVEAADEGIDTIRSSVTFHAGAENHVENIFTTDEAGYRAIDLSGTDSANTLRGNKGANQLSALGGDDVIFALAGDDTVDGGAGDDMLDGGSGNDSLSGGTGDDVLRGQSGRDTIIGGAGSDTIYGDAGNDEISGGEGNDTLRGGMDDDSLSGGVGADNIYGNEGDDTLEGGADKDTLRGDDGDDHLSGGHADDLIYGGAGQDRLFGGAGVDRLFGNEGDDSLDGGIGDDMLYGGAGRDTAVFGVASTAVLASAGATSMVISTAEGRDFVKDDVEFFQFTDKILSWEETALLKGTPGPLEGPAPQQTLEGTERADWLTADEATRTITGGTGMDMVSFVNLTQRVAVDLGAGTAISGGETIALHDLERVTGSVHSDLILGDSGHNELRGLGGFDWFNASGGGDTYDGGTGRDMISYVLAEAAVTVDLGAGQGLAGMAQGDTYTSIERATGSIYSDLFYGGDGEEDFRGLGGFDWFVGSGSKDRYDGGSGSDTVSYALSTSGVVASLALGRGSSGDAARDLYTSIERLTGSSFDDLLTGDDGRNILRGLWGEDVLMGNGGVDRLTGGASDDLLNGGDGFDYAFWSHNRDDYAVSTVNGITFVEHLNGGREGVDTVLNVEALVFADDTLFL